MKKMIVGIAIITAAAFFFAKVYTDLKRELPTLDQDISGSMLRDQWNLSVENNGQARAEFLDGEVQDSRGVFKIFVSKIGNKSLGDIQLLRTNIPVKPGVRYRLSLRLKGSQGSVISLGAETPRHEPIVYLKESLKEVWQIFTVEFTPKVNQIRLPVHLSFPSNDGATIYIADVKIDGIDEPVPVSTPADAPKESAVTTVLDFDNALAKDDSEKWQRLVFGNGNSASFSVTNSDRVSNSRALKIQINRLQKDGDVGGIQAVRDKVAVNPNSPYFFSAWVNGPAGAEIIFGIEGPENLNLASRKATLSGQWQKLSFAFRSEFPYVRIAIHLASHKNENATITLDAVQIRARQDSPL